MNEVRGFFTQRLLKNPRLVYLWAETGGGLCEYAEPATRDVYRREVGVAGRNLDVDEVGPFGTLTAGPPETRS
jgi:hypothetical protein